MADRGFFIRELQSLKMSDQALAQCLGNRFSL